MKSNEQSAFIIHLPTPFRHIAATLPILLRDGSVTQKEGNTPMRHLAMTSLQKLITPRGKGSLDVSQRRTWVKSYPNDATVSKNNVTDVFDNRTIATGTIAKCLSCLRGGEATPMIRHRTTRFGSTCTKSQETGLPNWLIDTSTAHDSQKGKCGSNASVT